MPVTARLSSGAMTVETQFLATSSSWPGRAAHASSGNTELRSRSTNIYWQYFCLFLVRIMHASCVDDPR